MGDELRFVSALLYVKLQQVGIKQGRFRLVWRPGAEGRGEERAGCQTDENFTDSGKCGLSSHGELYSW